MHINLKLVITLQRAAAGQQLQREMEKGRGRWRVQNVARHARNAGWGHNAAAARIVRPDDETTWPVACLRCPNCPSCLSPQPVKKSVCLLISQTSTPAVCVCVCELTWQHAWQISDALPHIPPPSAPSLEQLCVLIWAVNWKIIVRRPLNYNAQWTHGVESIQLVARWWLVYFGPGNARWRAQWARPGHVPAIIAL